MRTCLWLVLSSVISVRGGDGEDLEVGGFSEEVRRSIEQQWSSYLAHNSIDSLPVHSRQTRPSACDEAAEEEVTLYKFNYEDAEGEESTILMPKVQVSYLHKYFICIISTIQVTLLHTKVPLTMTYDDQFATVDAYPSLNCYKYVR